MAGRREVGFLKATGVNLKEQLAMAKLRNVRLQGHTYVDLRRDGKRSIFFCTLCLAPCYSDSILDSHLKGSLHCERLTAAKATLLKSNPWPFDDGVLFFGDNSEQDTDISVPKCDSIQLLDNISENDERSIVCYQESVEDASGDGHTSNVDVGFHLNPDGVGAENISHDTCTNDLADGCYQLVIPGVLCKDGLSQLEVTCFGVAQIAARFCKEDRSLSKIRKLWCEWLGRGKHESKDTLILLEHDFAIVTFSYNYNLGRKGFSDDIKLLLPSSPHSELEENAATMNRKRKSSSDPEDFSESLTAQDDSSGEESLSSNSSKKRMLLEGCDDQLLFCRVLSSKSIRRELRQQQQAASERMCDICQQKMLPGKDVSALMNRKTGRLACSSRNSTGAFHVFHVSCLIHWILLCEMENYEKQLNATKPKRRSKRKVGTKQSEAKKAVDTKQVFSAFCPECQGTGVAIDGDELEKPTVPLSDIFKYKIKLSDGCRAWMKSPEVLPNCSTGFFFPDHSEDTFEEAVLRLRLLRFYRANGQC